MIKDFDEFKKTFEDMWLGDLCEYTGCFHLCKKYNKKLFNKCEAKTKKLYGYNYSMGGIQTEMDVARDDMEWYEVIRSTLDLFLEHYGYTLSYDYGLEKM